jgi:hypothetical protein
MPAAEMSCELCSQGISARGSESFKRMKNRRQFLNPYCAKNQGVVVTSVFKKFSNALATFRSPEGV